MLDIQFIRAKGLYKNRVNFNFILFKIKGRIDYIELPEDKELKQNGPFKKKAIFISNTLINVKS